MEQQDLSERRRDPTMRMIEHHVEITSADQVLALAMIDWNRLHGYWRTTADALHTIASTLALGTACGKRTFILLHLGTIGQGGHIQAIMCLLGSLD